MKNPKFKNPLFSQINAIAKFRVRLVPQEQIQVILGQVGPQGMKFGLGFSRAH